MWWMSPYFSFELLNFSSGPSKEILPLEMLQFCHTAESVIFGNELCVV